MAATAYPHMIFATGPDVITKELLHEVLAEAYPHGTVTDAPLKSVLTLDDYAFSFWFDDEAEGLAQRYAGYLPEGARRRRLVACTTMIDFCGGPDPDQAHRTDAERIATELAELDGVWVFSEESKRFVGLDYGEPPLAVSSAPATPAAPETPTIPDTPDTPTIPAAPDTPTIPAAPVTEPAVASVAEPEPAPAAESIEPPVESDWTPAAGPSASELAAYPSSAPGPAAPPSAPEPAAWPRAEEDRDAKEKFFKRVFKRKNP